MAGMGPTNCITHWGPLLAKTPERYSRRTFSLRARSPCPAKAMVSGDAGSPSANGLWLGASLAGAPVEA
eukprot:1612031-Alexandrium_andersonii.AAC.1